VNTHLSSEQASIKEKYHAFAREHVAPQVRGLESHSVCLKEFIQQLAQNGYLGISAPKEYGGQGQPFLFSALFAEAVGTQEPGLGLTLANHYAFIEVLKKYGTDTQKSRYLPLLSRGEALGTVAFSEEQAGTDYTAVGSVLSKEGDGFAFNGKKAWVVNGQLAGLALVLCKNVEGESDSLAVCVIDCTDNEKECGPNIGRMGLKSAYVNHVEFKNRKLSSDARLSGANAEKIAAYALDVAKVILAASAVGLTFAALERALEHARNREQFGTKISQFQGIQWKLADMGTEAEGARMQLYRAAWSLDSEPEKLSTYAPMCKWYAAKVARQHSGEALQVMGASGLLEDEPLEKFYRDAKAMEICLGTSEAQKVQLVEALKI
jgi:alkylation response protein AidB-like acyl-CoA dehydrogenase